MIVAIVGTGTGVGKTHVAAALLRHLRMEERRAVGWKPVESGVVGAIGEDEAALREACGVSPPTLRFAAALAPHLAARLQGGNIDGAGLTGTLARLAADWPLVVLELAGGWFSPFDERVDNAEWLGALPEALRLRLRPVLVAPDRLGVLHDVSAACRAASALGQWPVAIALSRQGGGVVDASSASNADELRSRSLTREIPVFSIPRAAPAELARSGAIAALAERVLASAALAS
jgi:dethiobiotin synthetase